MANLFLGELCKNSSNEIVDLIQTVDFHFIPTINPGLYLPTFYEQRLVIMPSISAL